MIKMKKSGFTLSEVLITLTIVGALAALVLPGLIKNANSRAMMSLLEGTVSNLNNAVQSVLTSKGSLDTLNDNTIKSTFDVKRTCTTTTDSCTGSAYKNLKGETVETAKIFGPGGGTFYLLQNGVTISGGIDATQSDNSNVLFRSYFIDLNGAKEPNIVGVDAFFVCASKKTSVTDGVHVGDVGSCFVTSKTKEELKTACKSGSGFYCYTLAEQSGFDPDYINK